ncbi:hypothetical protein ACVDFE_15710 [Lentzea chajnantorensis]
MRPSEIKVNGTGSATASGPGAVSSTGVIINVSQAPDGNSPQSPAKLTPKQALIAVAAALTFILLMGLVSCFYDPDEEFTTDSGARPPSAKSEILTGALEEALRNCAKAVVPVPLNCPQAADASITTNKIVTWSLHGDPIDGHQIAWRDDHFNVRGNAIMSLEYKSYFDDPQIKTFVVGYEARIDWKNEKASVGPIKGTAPVSGNNISKRTADVSLEDLLPAVRAVFDECDNTTRVPPPPKCPQPANMSRQEQADWSFTGDPLLNVRMEFEQFSGLIKIHGSYASEVRYKQAYIGDITNAVSGNFTALAVLDRKSTKVIQIVGN